ncbi:MAG: hypothetical protein ACO4CG_04770 [Prochlorothrix sp.]|nr:hypothetical protein [Prochlorothrix sp.]
MQSSAGELLSGTTKAIGGVAENTSQTIGGAIQGTTQAVGGVLDETEHWVNNTRKQTGDALSTTTRAVGATVGTTQKLLGETVSGAGQAIGSTVQNTGKALGQTVTQAGQAAGSTLQYSTQLTGNLIQNLDASPELQKLTKELNLEWLLPVINNVDIQGAGAATQQLQNQYPQESANEIANRLIQQKAVLVGGMGLASSLIPGVAAALLTVDMAGLALVQAELGYQIAAAYGLDLEDPARKGEVLAIFGAAMGTNFALKTGIKAVLRNVPIAGGVVGASTNAMALYAVGYAACRFYNSQGQALVSEAAAQAALDAGADYLEAAQEQQLLVDQIIAHMVKASFPDRTWAETLPELEPYHLSPASLATIEAHLDTPTPLTDLLDNLDDDYTLVALFACQSIANADNTITPPKKPFSQRSVPNRILSKGILETKENPASPPLQEGPSLFFL